MAASDEIFLALDGDLGVAAERIAEVLGLEANGGLCGETGEWQYTGRARSFDGVTGVYVGPNRFLPKAGRAVWGSGAVVAQLAPGRCGPSA